MDTKATPEGATGLLIEIGAVGAYRLITIGGELRAIADLAELKFLVKGYLKQGESLIAVKFAHNSYLYSGAISVLVDCYRMIDDQKGRLCVLETNPETLDILHRMNLDSIVHIYSSEEDLLEQEPPALRQQERDCADTTGTAGQRSS